MVQGNVASIISRCTPASCGAENRGFSKRPIIARMRKANAFSTPGDVVGGGGAALLLKKEAMVLVLVLQAVLLAPAADLCCSAFCVVSELS